MRWDHLLDHISRADDQPRTHLLTGDEGFISHVWTEEALQRKVVAVVFLFCTSQCQRGDCEFLTILERDYHTNVLKYFDIRLVF